MRRRPTSPGALGEPNPQPVAEDCSGTGQPSSPLHPEVGAKSVQSPLTHLPIPAAPFPVRRQLLLPVVLPHLRMLPGILRMIVPAVSGESRAAGTPGTGTRCPEHAAARGVRRRRARQSAATRASSWTAGTAPCKPGRTTIMESHGERRVTRVRDVGCGVPADRSSPHEAPPTASVHPPATCRVARADRCSRVFPGPLRNGV